MQEPRDLQSLIEAAEQAAAAGDYASAEQRLRDVAGRQEAELGPLHPDLANTLNNLGIVCEITNKPADAEQFFRRAWTIATASLEPSHPFVATSRKNLEDFCKAHGTAVDLPTPVAEPAKVESPVSEPPEPIEPVQRHADTVVPEPVQPRKIFDPMTVGAAIAAVLLIVAVAMWLRPATQDSPAASNTTGSAPATSREKPEPPRTSATAPPAGAPAPASPRAQNPRPAPPQSAQAAKNNSVVPVEARLCRALTRGSSWQCTPLASPVEPATLFFYTRVKSPTDTTVQHRWYHGERLVKRAELSILANPTAGYRTYSRNAVDAQAGGNWRVELRTKDGALLHEERFTVR
jgi:hypothetical protein